MLTEIRDRSSGWFAWVIAALIIIPMTFWGVQEYANTSANPSVIEIGDQKVSLGDFQAQFSNQQQRLRQSMGEQVNNDYLSSDGFKQNVFQQLLNRTLIEQVAADQNYRIGDKQLADFIKQSELFQTEGKFDQSAYERYVASSQYSKERYESALRADQRLAQVTAGYEESALVLPDDIRSLLELQTEKRSFEIVTLKQEDYVADIQIEESEIAEYYDNNQQSFLEEEKVTVQYLELNIEDIAATITIDEDELRVIYENNAESYISEEKRDTRHILLSTTSGEDADAQLAKAQNLVKELKAGADFSELAKANSQDTGTAANGGSLGLVETGQMVPEFETATFSLEEGAISDPIKTQFGYHIIQVSKIQIPEQQSFEEVKFDLQQEEKDRMAEEQLLEKADELRNLAFEQSDNLEGIAETLNLTVKTSDTFDRNNGTGIAVSAAVRSVAFSDEILVDNINSEPIEINDGQYVVIRKDSYQASAPKPLTTVAEQIKQTLTGQKAAQAAELAGDELLEQAKTNWQTVLDSGKEISSHVVSLIDQERVVAPDVLQKISTMHLEDGQAAIDSVIGRNGDFNLVRLLSIEAGDVNSVSEQVKARTRQILAQRNGQSLMRTYVDGLNESLKPVINTDLL